MFLWFYYFRCFAQRKFSFLWNFGHKKSLGRGLIRLRNALIHTVKGFICILCGMNFCAICRDLSTKTNSGILPYFLRSCVHFRELILLYSGISFIFLCWVNKRKHKLREIFFYILQYSRMPERLNYCAIQIQNLYSWEQTKMRNQLCAP